MVARFSVSKDPNVAKAASEVELLRQPKEEAIHNVGNRRVNPPVIPPHR